MTTRRSIIAARPPSPRHCSGAARPARLILIQPRSSPSYGLFVPAGTPREVVNKLHGEIARLMDSAEMKERLAGLGVESTPGTPDQLASLMQGDLVRWAKMVKDSGAQLD